MSGNQKKANKAAPPFATRENALDGPEISAEPIENQFRAMFEASGVGMAHADLSGHVTMVNDAACCILGYDEAEILGRPLNHFAHPENRSEVSKAPGNNPLGGPIETRYVRKDGAVIWAQITTNGIRDKAGHATGAFSVIQDITPQKNAEEAARQSAESHDRHARLLEGVTLTTPDFFYVFDLEGRVIYANRRLLEVWGMTLPSVIGKTCRELGYEQWHHDMHMREIADVIATRQPIKGEVPFKAPLTGTFGIYEYIFTPVLNAQGEVELVAGTTRDVTDRKRIENELRSRSEQFSMLLKHAPIGVYLVDADLRISQVNPIARATFGDPPGLVGSSLAAAMARLWTAEYADEVMAIFRNTLSTGEPFNAPERSELRADRNVFEYYTWQLNRITLSDGRHGVVCYFSDISEQVRARQAIMQSEAQYRELFNSMTEGFCVIAMLDAVPGQPPDFRYVEANPAFVQQSGLLEVVGKTIRQVIPAEADEWIAVYKRVADSGESIRFERELLSQGRTLELYAYRVRHGTNRQVGVIFRDITQRKHAELQLQRTHDTFYHLIEHNPFGIYVIDADFCLRQVSLGAQKVFVNVRPQLGRDFSEVLRTVWSEPFATEAIAHFRHTLDTGESYTSTTTVARRHDIEELESYDWRIERITLPDGRFGVVCYFYDLSERQRWDEALRLSDERFQLVARATNDAIWDWNIPANSLWWNEGLNSLFGHGVANATRQGITWWEETVHPEDRHRVLTRLHDVLAGGETFWRVEYRFQRADRAYADVLDRGYVIRDEKGAAVRMIGAMQDLTERKRSEVALATAQEALQNHAINLEGLVEERTAKLRETITELEALSYSISHDMRAPLRAMQGFSQALFEDHKDQIPESGLEHLHRISGAARRMDSLIQDILLYTKVAREQLTLKPVSLEPLIREIIQTYHPDQENRITLFTPFPNVMAHEAFLSQIISNLLTNALKFVKPGDEPQVQLRCESTGESVKLWIEDKGVGIAPEHSKRIFQVFGRVYSESEYAGTGIGLAIVKRAVERLGGEVGVESTLGEGSRFWICLQKA